MHTIAYTYMHTHTYTNIHMYTYIYILIYIYITSIQVYKIKYINTWIQIYFQIINNKLEIIVILGSVIKACSSQILRDL